MSAIARYCRHAGLNVSGYDRTPSPVTEALEKEDIPVHFDSNVSLIPPVPEETLVIYTPAVPSDMAEMVYVREHGYRIVKRAEALGEITSGKRCLAVSGTHGKTTTSTMLAHILAESGEGCTAFLGGISKNYGTNLLLGDNDVIVAEADEFDRSFLHLHPEAAVVTSMDPLVPAPASGSCRGHIHGRRPSGHLFRHRGPAAYLRQVRTSDRQISGN